MSRQPTIKQLKYLCAVADQLHFGRAAECCHVSQSTLSAGLLELEEALGVPLVERSNRTVLLTATGSDIVRRSQSILSAVDDLVSAADASRRPFSGEMRLGVIPTIAPFMLPDLLTELRREHPDFRLYIREDLSAQLIHALESGELDLLLLALPYRAERVETLHLFYDEFYLAFDAGHPVGERQNLKTADLRGLDLLLLEDGHCLRDHALEACRLQPDDIRIPFQATSLNTIVQMVANNIGLTLIPRMALERNILSGTGLRARPFSEKHVHRSIGLMWRQRSPRRHEFELIGEFIRSLQLTQPDRELPPGARPRKELNRLNEHRLQSHET